MLIGETEKIRKIKEQVYSGCLYLVYTMNQPIAHVVGLTEKRDKTFNKKKKIEEIKEKISTSSLIQVHMIHQPTVHVWTKFQLCRPLNP